MRIRYLVGETDPTIVGYDQDRWAATMDYHAHPIAPALATVAAVRANTVPLLRRMTAEQWGRRGRHTESGSYGAEDWLQTLRRAPRDPRAANRAEPRGVAQEKIGPRSAYFFFIAFSMSAAVRGAPPERSSYPVGVTTTSSSMRTPSFSAGM